MRANTITTTTRTRRNARRRALALTDPQRGAGALTIRTAGPADRPALLRLAQLDSVPPSRRKTLEGQDGVDPVPTLIAEVAGELRAAITLDDGLAIATPFERTAELVALLRGRAAHLRTVTLEHSRSGGRVPASGTASA
jgi:hypothetical protein